MTARDKVLSLEEVEPSLYEGIDLDRLVVYAVAKLSEIQQDLSLENIIVASFKLFPKKFSLLGYGEYPDATRVEKSLWRSKGRKRGWVGGMTAHGYSVTEKGRLIASRVNQLLLTGGVHGKKATSQTRRKEAIFGEVTSSRAYQKYEQRRAESISDAEVCFVLQGTMDSLPETLRDNLTSLKSIADELERKDLMTFLEYIEKRFSRFLGLR